MVSCATKSGEGDSQDEFPLQKLEGTVNNMTLSDAVYKGVVLCGWLKEGWSVHRFTSLRCQLHHCKFGVFLKGECFIGMRSAKMECLQV